MARFDKSDVKRIVEYFEELGYSVTFFDSNDESRNEQTSFYESPITIQGAEKNDVYNIYNKYRGTSWDLRQSFKIQDGKLTFVGDPNYFKVELVSSGTKLLDDEELDMDEYQSANEFANFENFDSVEAPNYAVIYGDDPQVSVASPILNIDELTASQIKKAEEKLKSSKTALAELIRADKKGDLSTAMWSFDEIDELYNSKITAEDKRAYFIYLQNKNRKKLGGDWFVKYGSSYPAQATDILELMKKGALFYDPTAKIGERLQPKVIYKSGNIWKKWASIDNKKDEYIKRFGEEIYQLHFKTLEPVYNQAKANKLLVRGAKEMRLHLVPISSLAQDIKIGAIVNPSDKSQIEKNFKVYTSFKKGELVEDYTRSSWDGSSNNFINKKVISLYEGFILWCKMAGRGKEAQAVGVQWSNITTSVDELLDYYLKPTSNPFSKEKGADEKWARYQDDGRKVGERLFAQFLADGLEADDQVRVETIWNSVYNAYVEPNLDEVPIGFTYKKYLDNLKLFTLKESNLRAIKYYLTRGSIGLAYGVGLGKTFCSIFAMKQALDLGTAKRPLVIVPNQVYFQFGQEIKRALGSDFDPTSENSRLNMFYNGGGIYNQLGNNAVDGINLCTYEATEAFQFDKKNLEMSWVEEAVSILEMGGEIQNEFIIDNFVGQHRGGLFNEESIESDTDESDEYEEVVDSNVEEDDDLGDFDEGGVVEGKKKRVIEPIVINQESVNFDMVVVDEAHNFNNLFSAVVSEPKTIQKAEKDKRSGKIKIQREKNPYSKIRETSGGKSASSRAEKLWFISRFIQRYNPMGNTMLLSATPFTNSPLQIFTMMAYLNYDMLYNADLGILKDFFDTYAKIEYAEDFRTDLTIVKRNKFVGWTNVISLQKYVYRVFDKSSREEEDKSVVRPNKWVLPLKNTLVDGKLVQFAKENYVSTTIRMSDLQLSLWKNVRAYAQGDLTYEELFSAEQRNTTSLGKYVDKKPKKATEATQAGDSAEVDITDADNLADGTREGEQAKATAKALQCLMWGRQIALNPYLFKGSGFKNEPTGRMYVEQSPKILYVMECIRSIKQYYDANPQLGYCNNIDADNPQFVSGMSGQVIYMNFGTKAFELIRDYLVEEIGFDINEIGIIRGDGNYIGKKRYDSKQRVADAFLGRVLNAETGKYEFLSNEKRVKVLIGSESIKEGINLQDYASVLYNCFLDFNPTDMVQVEGRIWRQGNALQNVRINTPLMADCIDVFMFQKLEDKTERINQIWTKNGNANELDTTAFNPAELKYELLTDPIAIAQLEREYKKDQLEEQKAQEGEILSSYLTIASLYKKTLEIKYEAFRTSRVWRSQYFGMYYNIFQIRPDLIDKPLYNNDFYVNTLAKNIYQEGEDKWKSRSYIYSFDDFISKYPNIPSLGDEAYYVLDNSSQYNLWSSNVQNPLWRSNLERSLNYTIEQLVELMVQVIKDQKIAYPIGYSKNWRELIPKMETPIVEGDEVEFDTKKGRKKGIADVVLNSSGISVLKTFYYSICYQFTNNDTDRKNIEEALVKLKLTELQKPNSFDNSNLFDEFDDKTKNQIASLLRYFYETDPNNMLTGYDGKILPNLKPITIDSGELEDLNIEEKNIVKVKKAGAEKKVEPTKYPEPFVWSNKDRDENLNDIAQYLGTIVYAQMSQKLGGDNSNPNLLKFWASNQPSEYFPLFNDELQCIIQIVKPTSSRITNDSLKMYKAENQNLSKTWAELMDSWKDTGYGGLFHIYSSKIYDSELPLTLADFKRMEEKKIKPLGINNYQDVENLVAEQKVKINTLSLEQRQLDDQQVFQELVEEVMRKQEELNSEEIRAGSSFKARATLFATPNTDYLGNEMLSIFVNSAETDIEKCKKDVIAKIKSKREKKVAEPLVEIVEVVEEEVVEETTDGDLKEQTKEFIAQLKPALKFYKGAEKKEFQEYIKSMEAFLTTFD